MANGGFVLRFEVDGDTQIMRGFSRFADDVKDMSEAFREIVQDFHRGEERQFATSGGYGAGGWAALAPSTLERKTRGGYPSDILVRTGRLKASLVEAGAHGVVERIAPLEMQVGTTLPYALFHQRGTRAMPSRRLIALPEEQKTRWHKIIHRYLVTQIGRAF